MWGKIGRVWGEFDAINGKPAKHKPNMLCKRFTPVHGLVHGVHIVHAVHGELRELSYIRMFSCLMSMLFLAYPKILFPGDLTSTNHTVSL
jgi:hypothetical protein